MPLRLLSLAPICRAKSVPQAQQDSEDDESGMLMPAMSHRSSSHFGFARLIADAMRADDFEANSGYEQKPGEDINSSPPKKFYRRSG